HPHHPRGAAVRWLREQARRGCELLHRARVPAEPAGRGALAAQLGHQPLDRAGLQAVAVGHVHAEARQRSPPAGSAPRHAQLDQPGLSVLLGMHLPPRRGLVVTMSRKSPAVHPRALVPGCLALAAAALVPSAAARAADPAPLEASTTGSVELVELDAEGNSIEPEDPELLAAKQRPWIRRFIPRRNMWEVGFFGGLWLPSDVIELHDRNLPPIRYDTSAELGLRVGYYPLQHFGLEGELAMIPSRLETEQRAFVSTARAHAVLQL